MQGTVVDARERKANKMNAVPVTIGGGTCTIIRKSRHGTGYAQEHSYVKSTILTTCYESLYLFLSIPVTLGSTR